MKRSRNNLGFTLVEMMMAVVLSIIVFAALGTLLSRCFSLWVDSQAHWTLAQHSRITRTRIANGGFGVGSGLLSATNVVIVPYAGYQKIIYNPIDSPNEFHMYCPTGETLQNIWMYNPGTAQWAFAQSVTSYGPGVDRVLVNNSSVTFSNDTLRLNYTLNFPAMGKNFEHPQTVVVRLVNDD